MFKMRKYQEAHGILMNTIIVNTVEKCLYKARQIIKSRTH